MGIPKKKQESKIALVSNEDEEVVKVCTEFTAKITAVYTMPKDAEPLSKEDLEMFLKVQYDDAHVTKVKHFFTEE